MSDKTIRMPAELLAKWLAALRSGEYKQCTGRLKNGDGYCCLGVLADVAGDLDPEALLLPMDWRLKHGVTFLTENGSDRAPEGPYLSTFDAPATYANDKLLAMFPEIADAIELCAEGT